MQQKSSIIACAHCGAPVRSYAFQPRLYCSRKCRWEVERRSLADRFWEKVDKNGPAPTHHPDLGPCWLWTGSTTLGGYGNIGRGGTGTGVALTHRVSWEMHFGPIPTDLAVMHRCDTRRCVNPGHLELGTTGDNNRDMYAKGRAGIQQHPERAVRGSHHGMAKITEADIPDIRRAYDAGEDQATIGARYGISQTSVSRIGLRQTWRHVK